MPVCLASRQPYVNLDSAISQTKTDDKRHGPSAWKGMGSVSGGIYMTDKESKLKSVGNGTNETNTENK